MEGEARLQPVDPAYLRLERLEAVELDPYALLEAGALDELDPAAVLRQVEHARAEVELTRAPQRDLGGKRHALAPALAAVALSHDTLLNPRRTRLRAKVCPIWR